MAPLEQKLLCLVRARSDTTHALSARLGVDVVAVGAAMQRLEVKGFVTSAQVGGLVVWSVMSEGREEKGT